MSVAGDQFAHLVSSVGNYATDEFANSTDDLFTALDEGEPVVPSTMCPPIRQAIVGMIAVLDEMTAILDALEK